MSWNSYPGQGQHQYSNNPPPPQWGQAPPPPQGYNSLGSQSYYPPPPSQNQNQGYGYGAPPPPQGGWQPPTGQAPQQQYHQTNAGYRPPNEYQQGVQAPYGPSPGDSSSVRSTSERTPGVRHTRDRADQCSAPADTDSAVRPAVPAAGPDPAAVLPVLAVHRAAQGPLCRFRLRYRVLRLICCRSGSTTTIARPSWRVASTMRTTCRSS